MKPSFGGGTVACACTLAALLLAGCGADAADSGATASVSVADAPSAHSNLAADLSVSIDGEPLSRETIEIGVGRAQLTTDARAGGAEVGDLEETAAGLAAVQHFLIAEGKAQRGPVSDAEIDSSLEDVVSVEPAPWVLDQDIEPTDAEMRSAAEVSIFVFEGLRSAYGESLNGSDDPAHDPVAAVRTALGDWIDEQFAAHEVVSTLARTGELDQRLVAEAGRAAMALDQSQLGQW